MTLACTGLKSIHLPLNMYAYPETHHPRFCSISSKLFYPFSQQTISFVFVEVQLCL